MMFKTFKELNFFIVIFAVFFFMTAPFSPAQAIKIGLYTQVEQATIGTSRGGNVVNARNGNTIMQLSPMKAYKISSLGGKIIISADGKSFTTADYIYIKPAVKEGLVYSKKNWYRGYFEAFSQGGVFTLINDVDMESYIQGVVPSEMPARWNAEALKAQAIAARSYAIANYSKRSKYGYNLKDTTEDQVYRGASAETIKTNDLVNKTRGQVLVCGNKVIPAYYHASSGGHTLPSGAVWGKDLPFLRPVNAYDGNLPKKGHGIGMSQHGANTLANAGYNAYQILGYFYKNVRLYYLQY